jgi:general secretion pathway protein H
LERRRAGTRRGGHDRYEGSSARRARASSRAITLIEVLITIAIIAVVSGAVIGGIGGLEASRLKGSAMMISSAVRTAYTYANASSKVVRLVFDFETRRVMIEESSSKLLLAKNDVAGGAEAATEAERRALEEGDALLKGPRPPRARFTAAKIPGFQSGEGEVGKDLSNGIRFFQIETAHDELAMRDGRAYLYFWPGGQTERAAIQLLKGGATDTPGEHDVLTVIVAPLTGRSKVLKGLVAMPRPRTDIEESEREDGMF